MTRTEQLRALHPDTNGGDHSRVGEFVALIEKLRNVCQCGCKAPLRYGRTRFLNLLHYQLHRRGQTAQRLIGSLLLLLLIAGCSAPRSLGTAETSPPLPQTPVRRFVAAREVSAIAAAVTPPRMIGCQWDAPTNYNPLVESFEVWATPDLQQPFTLKTNTTELKALWPMQASEFYRVRTRGSDGQVSEWATTKKGL